LPPDPTIVDARGLRCPLPVLKAEKALEQMKPGALLVVLATDPIAKVDIPLFCRRRGYACEVSTAGDELRFEIVVSP
jgi:tRNA 2-thiouridine synthesizing protein A